MYIWLKNGKFKMTKKNFADILNFFSLTKNSWFGCGDFDNEAFTFE
jgi:hypothetical protein